MLSFHVSILYPSFNLDFYPFICLFYPVIYPSICYYFHPSIHSFTYSLIISIHPLTQPFPPSFHPSVHARRHSLTDYLYYIEGTECWGRGFSLIGLILQWGLDM